MDLFVFLSTLLLACALIPFLFPFPLAKSTSNPFFPPRFLVFCLLIFLVLFQFLLSLRLSLSLSLSYLLCCHSAKRKKERDCEFQDMDTNINPLHQEIAENIKIESSSKENVLGHLGCLVFVYLYFYCKICTLSHKNHSSVLESVTSSLASD